MSDTPSSTPSSPTGRIVVRQTLTGFSTERQAEAIARRAARVALDNGTTRVAVSLDAQGGVSVVVERDGQLLHEAVILEERSGERVATTTPDPARVPPPPEPTIRRPAAS